MSHATDTQVSYCLDIGVGYDERYRDELIELLQLPIIVAQFELTRAQRGMWQGSKLLRVLTPKAHELVQYIIKNLRTGDDNDYEVHDNGTDADRSMTWLPDYDTEHGYKWFDLIPVPASS
ncbi:MAG: hypothetical protein WAW13_02910 [Minisyncoccia bacterium]